MKESDFIILENNVAPKFVSNDPEIISKSIFSHDSLKDNNFIECLFLSLRKITNFTISNSEINQFIDDYSIYYNKTFDDIDDKIVNEIYNRYIDLCEKNKSVLPKAVPCKRTF